MKVLFINAVCGTGSTGKICIELAKKYETEGHEVKIAYGRHAYVPDEYKKYAIRIGNNFDVKLHALQTRIFDTHGFASIKATKKFLKWADEFKPDLLWLHNLHGYYINIELLFKWIKQYPNMKINWTLHDCWAFTGHCAHFTAVGCEKWKTHCCNCEQKKQYPASLFLDNSYKNFELKKKLFTGIKNLEIIVPSNWLANLVKQSFLKEYPIKVIHNKIDTSIFKPLNSDFKEKNNLTDKKIILGVANVWDDRKGLKDFLKLSNMVDDKYKIVLVGLTKKQIDQLPVNILGIERTKNQKELVEIYSSSFVFFNPTYEDNYPTVNLEAQACGIPVITYDTGGCRETLYTKNSFCIKKDVYEVIKILEAINGET